MFSDITKFRKKLADGRLCLGAGVTTSDPAVVEALGPSVDFLWVDLEHNPISLETLHAHLIAARACETAALVRVPDSATGFLKRTLDTGATAVAVPQVRSAQEVETIVAACRYAPEGTRGFGPRRLSNYGRVPDAEYIERANRSVFVVVQIENVAALADLDAIVRVQGLDSVMVGPYDLACDMGKRGDVADPEVQAAIKTIIARARKAGLWVGMGMPPNADQAAEAFRQGVHWVQCGGDLGYMIRYVESIAARLRETADR